MSIFKRLLFLSFSILFAFVYSLSASAQNASYPGTDKPEASLPSPKRYCLLSQGLSSAWKAELAGGTAGKWYCEWEVDGTVVKKFSSELTPSDYNFNKAKIYTIKLTAVNSSEDGGKGDVYYSNSFEGSLTVYANEVSLEVVSPAKSALTGASMTWKALGKNSVGVWKYEWTVDQKTVPNSNSQNFTYTFPKEGKYIIQLNAQNFAPDGQTVLYQCTSAPYIITIYDAPAVEMISPSVKYYVLGEDDIELTWRAKFSDDNSTGWSCRWEINGERTEKPSSTLTHKLTEAGTYEIHMDAVYRPEGDTLKHVRLDDKITVYGIHPSVKVTPSATSCLQNGGPTFSATVIDGVPDGSWSYEWKVDDKTIQNDNSSQFHPIFTELGEHTVQLIATLIAPDGKTVLYKDGSYTVSITVLEAPEVSMEKPDLKYYRLVGSGVELSWKAIFLDGNSTGWSCRWEINGERIGKPGSVFTQTFTKAGIYNVKMIASYAPDGVELTSLTDEDRIVVFDKIYASPVSPQVLEYVDKAESIPYSLKTECGEEISGGKWNVVWCQDSVKVQSGESLTHNFTSATIGKHLVSADVSYAIDEDTLYNETIDFDAFQVIPHFTVLKEPLKAYVGDSYGKVVVKVPISLGGETNEAKPLAWNCKWTVDGKSTDVSIEYDASKKRYNHCINVDAPTLAQSEKKIVLTSRYSYSLSNGFVYTPETNRYEVYLYPMPTVQTNTTVNGYYGDKVNLTAEVSGGDKAGWTYEWSNGTSKNSISYEIKSGSSVGTAQLTVNNASTVDPTCKFYGKTFTYHINGYSKGSFDGVSLNDDRYTYNGSIINVYGNEQITIKPYVNGGYDKGWSYTWYRGNDIVNKSEDYVFVPKTDDMDFNPVSTTYSVKAINQIGDNIGCEKTFNFTIVVWPNAQMLLAKMRDTGFNGVDPAMDGPTLIREGNVIYPQLLVDNTHLGYSWRVGGNPVDEWKSSIVATLPSGSVKFTRDMNYALTVRYYFDGTQDPEEMTMDKVFRVYRRPETPSRLIQKGSGASGTIIAMMDDITDAELKSREYQLVFGYGDSVKQIVDAGRPEIRYNLFTSSELRHPQYIWAYAIWDYGDGVKISSGKRYLNGMVDEEFDGSIYGTQTTSRTATGLEEDVDATDIASYSSASPIIIQNGTVQASLNKPTDVTIKVYSTFGKLVSSQEYESVMHLNVPLQIGQHTAGMYLVEVLAGGTREVKKILINR